MAPIDTLRELVVGAMSDRADRERLWDMPLGEIDLEAMAIVVVETLIAEAEDNPTISLRDTP